MWISDEAPHFVGPQLNQNCLQMAIKGLQNLPQAGNKLLTLSPQITTKVQYVNLDPGRKPSNWASHPVQAVCLNY